MGNETLVACLHLLTTGTEIKADTGALIKRKKQKIVLNYYFVDVFSIVLSLLFF